MRWRRAIYKALNRRGARVALAVAASAYASLKTRCACRMFYEGAWVHQYPAGIIVEPKLNLSVLSEIKQQAGDYWMYHYVPKPGEIVVDVGAGTGSETLFFSNLVGPTGCVVSIEAHPHIYSCLKEMCRRNRLNNVLCLNCAVTNCDSEVFISNSEEYLTNNIFGSQSGFSVCGRTLDEIVASLHLPRVDLLKMNIEGAERLAVAGMAMTVRMTSHVCIACHDFLADRDSKEEMRSKSTVLAFLDQHGFDIVTRVFHPKPEVRDCVYGSKRREHVTPLAQT